MAIVVGNRFIDRVDPNKFIHPTHKVIVLDYLNVGLRIERKTIVKPVQ